MKFTKMHGAGNDYIYVNCFEETVNDPENLSIKLSDRHKGIGSDGLVLIMKSEISDFKMRMFNADGSEGKMCGNAARCVGKFVYDKHLTDKTSISLETLSGIKHLKLNICDGKVQSVKVNMGKAILNPKNIPVKSQKDIFVNEIITVNGLDCRVTCVSMGNPHCVFFTENIDKIPLEKIGPYFENHELFPDKINTEFVNIIDNKTLDMRVWERGSGETFACGTGACAAVVAAVLCGHCEKDTEITVNLRGGQLKIVYQSDETVFMEGDAVLVFETEIEI